MNIEMKAFQTVVDILNHRYENKTLVIVVHTIGERAYTIPIKSIKTVDIYDIAEQYGINTPIYEFAIEYKSGLKTYTIHQFLLQEFIDIYIK